MSYVINKDECIACGVCEAECPVGAISNVGDAYEIDANECLGCGACVGACPQEAISEE
ncbi:MAG: 4Fe-4S binding protein [Christensenellales bacterium]|jgi:NAD-dependent dihydropyrimidine dehydrogenase PreA subunit|nr:4Fe-4S binding protein [Clostridiales bacterium]HHV03247.1 4Fe-4S binding protein [Bacteroidales bacterium]